MRPLILLLLITLPLLSQLSLAHAQGAGMPGRTSSTYTDFTINIVDGPVEIRISNLEDLVLDFEPTDRLGPIATTFPCIYATQPGTKYAIELSGTVMTDGRTVYQYATTIVDLMQSAQPTRLVLNENDPTIPYYGTGYTPSYTEGCADFNSIRLEVQPEGDLTIETDGAAMATITITVIAL